MRDVFVFLSLSANGEM